MKIERNWTWGEEACVSGAPPNLDPQMVNVVDFDAPIKIVFINYLTFA